MRRLFALPLLALSACAAIPAPEAAEGAPVPIGQTVRVGEVRITPVQLLEDSRCPRAVNCIQAGTVRVQALVEAPGAASGLRPLTLQRPTVAGDVCLVLAEVTPEAEAGVATPPADYRFTFSAASGC